MLPCCVDSLGGWWGLVAGQFITKYGGGEGREGEGEGVQQKPSV